MTEVLLQELSNSDLEWMTATGKQQVIDPGTILMGEGNTGDSFYILLEGNLVTTVARQDNNPLAQAFATLEGNSPSGFEILRLFSGEVVGENIFTGLKSQALTISAEDRCSVVSLPLKELKTKLGRDKGFAARFYRAIAILYLNRLEYLLEHLGRKNFSGNQAVRDVLYIFGQLHDSDLDWAIANGAIEKIPAQTTLVRQGRPVEALYLLLDGRMSVAFESNQHNPLTNIFATLEGIESSGQEIAKLYRGEIIGEAPFIDGRLPYATVTAVENSVVLALSRPLLIAKLQQDVGFSARFYQAISTLLADKLQGIISKISLGRRTYARSQSFNDPVISEDEIDADTLEQMSFAATRFNWMLGRLKVSRA